MLILNWYRFFHNFECIFLVNELRKMSTKTNGKVINDPIYGLVNIHQPLILQLIDHPFFQRLRRIKQLSLNELVYPGATHTRFHHAIGAMHLMQQALTTLRQKGHSISETEYEAALIAILLHDIGHAPFSHSLEYTLLSNSHEAISLCMMKYLNQEMNGKLTLAVKIFENSYERKFFHQLVSGQLDTDRLDYLQRDSFFTGVIEGRVGADRILKLLDIHQDQLVVEQKGIYGIEHFLTARRIMYWQVYLHKTTLGAEQLLIQILERAKLLVSKNQHLFATPALDFFLKNQISETQFLANPKYLEIFAQLDDYDIWASLKSWTTHSDWILSQLCQSLLSRRLFRVELSHKKIDERIFQILQNRIRKQYKLSKEEVSYFLIKGIISNSAYLSDSQKIGILQKNGNVSDVAQISDLQNIQALTKKVKKYYLCYPKEIQY